MMRFRRALAATVVIVGLIGVVVVAVRGSYGAFRGGYQLTGEFSRASYGVQPGVQVEYRGIAVGRVDSVRLVGDHAELRLTIFDNFRVPASVQASIRPRSIFGDPFVDLVFGPGAPGPFLANGARLGQTTVDAETGDLIASVVPLLRHVNAQDLSVVITELAKSTAGQGARIGSAIDNGAQLANLYATTIDAQLRALDSFSHFQTALTPTGPSFNAIAANANVALPTLDAAEADLQQALDVLNQFASKLANFLAQERPDIDRLLNQGDNLVRLLTIREPQLEQVVTGLAEYVFKFASGRSPEALPNGTHFAYFKNFILFSDVTALICGVLNQGGPATAPVEQALASAGGFFDCSTVKAGPNAAPLSAAAAAQHDLANGAASLLGTPEVPTRVSVSALVDHILGRTG